MISPKPEIPLSVPLTDEQLRAVRTAYEMGYYEIPRGCTLSDIADRVGTSHQSISEALRRSHGALLGSVIEQPVSVSNRLWVTTCQRGRKRVAHTSPNCPELQDCSIRTIEPESAEKRGLSTCDVCPSDYVIGGHRE